MSSLSTHAELYLARRADKAYRYLSRTAKGALEELAEWCADAGDWTVRFADLTRVFGQDGHRNEYLDELVTKGFLKATPVKVRKNGRSDCDYTVVRLPSQPSNTNAKQGESNANSRGNLGGESTGNPRPENNQLFEESGLHVIGTVSALKREEREEKREELRGECAAVASSRPKRVREAKPKVAKAEAPRSMAHRVFAEVAKELGLDPRTVYLGHGSPAAVERAELIAQGGDLADAMRTLARGAIAWWRAGRSNSLRYAVSDWDGEAEVTPRATVTQLHGRQPRQAPCAPASAFKDQDPIEQILEYERRCAEHDEKLARTGTPFNPLVSYV